MRKTLLVLLAPILSFHAYARVPINPQFEQMMDGEEDYIKQIADAFSKIQEKQKAEGGKALRGTHSKGICAAAEFKVLDLKSTLPEDQAKKLAIGFFSQPGSYPAMIRFANAASKIDSDQVPDVRAISIAVQTPPALTNPQGRMDFAMNNATTFPINDAHVFADVMKFALDGGKAVFEMWPWESQAALNAVNLGELQKTAPTVPYQKMTYWSDVAFALGDDQAVKYEVLPCAENPSQKLTADPDTLSTELARHVNEDATMSCFKFGIQILDSGKLRDGLGQKHDDHFWVENANVEWSEDQIPFIPVAEIHLVAKSIFPQAVCDSGKIDVIGNNTGNHRGMGSINRARQVAEALSAETRLGPVAQPTPEPIPTPTTPAPIPTP